jgi:nicotinate dehydrogenase subunit A
MSTPRQIEFEVNHRKHVVCVEPETPLLYVLRNDLECNGPKFGCGLGQCGACTVLIGEVAARSCVMPVAAAEHQRVTTLEGLGTSDALDPVQQAFIDEQAAQCGYCLNGIIMMTKALLLRNADPSDRQIREELRYNLCRCGTHVEILRAVHRAAQLTRDAAAHVAAHVADKGQRS